VTVFVQRNRHFDTVVLTWDRERNKNIPRTDIGQTRRLHLTAVEVKIHMAHRISQSQERGRRVQDHHEPAAVHVHPFGFLTGFEIRLRRI